MRQVFTRRAAFVLLVLIIAVGWAGGRVWQMRVEAQGDRVFLYARAFDEAVARAAMPSTADLFRAHLPPAAGETALTEVPCVRDQKTLREDGPGACFFSFPGPVAALPVYCGVYPCIAIRVDERQWRDPAVTEAVKAVRTDAHAPCAAITRLTEAQQLHNLPTTVIDCGQWRAFRGAIFLEVVARTQEPGQPILIQRVRLS